MKAEQASSTAKVIAAGTIALASDPATAGLVSPGAAALCKRLLAGSTRDRWLARSARHPLTRAVWRAVESLTLPGIVAHYWHRKRWIEARCRASLDEGFQRVVVLGAGFDTLGLRLAREFSGLQVVEVDHPATQAAKRRALMHGGEPPPANLRFVACDLSRESLPADAAADAAADAGTVGEPATEHGTVFIAEGLLMYLCADRVAALLTRLGAAAAPKTRLIFSFMTRWPDGGNGFRPRSAWVERWLAWRGEPFIWALPPAEMRPLLARHGLRLLDLAQTADYTPHPAPHAAAAGRRASLEGENLVLCDALGMAAPAGNQGVVRGRPG